MLREYHITKINKAKIMSDLLYAFVLIFIATWAIGYFALNAGDFIHGLLIIAALALLLRGIQVSRAF
jgi:hypothetical protein